MAAGRARARSAEAIRTRPARGDLLDDGLLDNGLLDDSVDMRTPVNGAVLAGGPAYRLPFRDSHPMRWGRRSLGSTEREERRHDADDRHPQSTSRPATGRDPAPDRHCRRRPGTRAARGPRLQPLDRGHAAVAAGHAAGEPLGPARFPPAAPGP